MISFLHKNYIFLFTKQGSLIEEVNCTEPARPVRLSWFNIKSETCFTTYYNKLVRLSLSSFLPLPDVWDKDKAYPQNWVRFAVALPANIRLGWKFFSSGKCFSLQFCNIYNGCKKVLLFKHIEDRQKGKP